MCKKLFKKLPTVWGKRQKISGGEHFFDSHCRRSFTS